MLSTQDLKDLFAENTPERAVAKARKLASRGKTDQALQVLKETASRLGESADVRLEMATLLLGGGRVREAADSLRALLKAEPSSIAKVEEYIGWARAQYPDTEPLYEPLAEGQVARRNFTAAQDSLERLSKKSLETLLETRLQNLNRFIQKGSLVPKSALSMLYFAAIGYEALGEWQKSIEHYRKILAASTGEFSSVDERLKGLVGRNYKIVALRLAYAELLNGNGHPDAARQEFLKSLEIDPRSAPIVARHLEGRLEAQPEEPSLLWDVVKVRMAEADLPAALEICGRLVAKNACLPEIEKLLGDISASGNESVDTQLLLGRVLIAAGKVGRGVSAIVSAIGNDGEDKGIAALEEVVREHPGEARPYQILADYYLKQGRIAQCLETYKTLRRVDPSSIPSIVSRLQAVLLADPDNQTALEMLEDASLESADPQMSVPFLRRRLRRSPTDAGEALARLKPMLVSAPDDRGVRVAAAEASFASGDAAGAWSFLQNLIEPTKSPDPTLLHLLVLVAGASAELFQRVSSFLTTKTPRWTSRPEVVFALAEAAGRCGQFRSAVEGYREAAASSPSEASICHDAMRGLAKALRDERTPSGPDAGQRMALLAEALLDVGDRAAVADVLRTARDIPAEAAGRLATRLTAAVKADPEDLSLRTALAQALLAAGQVARALEFARKGLAGRDDAASAPLMLAYGDMLLHGGKLADATKAFATAARREPLLIPDAIERLEKIAEMDRSLETAPLALGRMLLHVGRLRDGVSRLMAAWSLRKDLGPMVLKDLDRVQRNNPGETIVDLSRSQILLEQGDVSAAVGALSDQVANETDLSSDVVSRLEGIVAQHPDSARAVFELGRAFLQKRWVERSCECLTRAYDLDSTLAREIAGPLASLQKQFPERPEPHLLRAAIYEGEARHRPAAEEYLKVARMESTRAEEALTGLRRLCSAGRSDTQEIQVMRATAARVLGHADEAVEAAHIALIGAKDLALPVRSEISQILAEDPRNVGALLVRADACIRLIDLEEAAKDLDEALRLAPARADEVAELVRAIQSRRPSFYPAVRLLAQALAICGDETAARQCLDSALATSEGRANLELLLARRALALRAGDATLARQLMARAESATVDRDALLALLHEEVISSSDGAATRSDAEPGLIEALKQGDYFRACEAVVSSPATTTKAWILERCGRPAEAAACLREILNVPEAASRFTGLHDAAVARQLEQRAEILVAETHLELEQPGSRTEGRPPSRKAALGGEAGMAVRGGRS